MPATVSWCASSPAPKIAALVAASCECSETMARSRPVSTARRAKPGLGEGAAVGVDVPHHAVRGEPLDHRPEARVNGGLAAGDHDAPEAACVQEVGAPQQLVRGVEEERRLAGVAAHRTVVVALLAEAEQRGAARGDRRVLRDAAS